MPSRNPLTAPSCLPSLGKWFGNCPILLSHLRRCTSMGHDYRLRSLILQFLPPGPGNSASHITEYCLFPALPACCALNPWSALWVRLLFSSPLHPSAWHGARSSPTNLAGTQLNPGEYQGNAACVSPTVWHSSSQSGRRTLRGARPEWGQLSLQWPECAYRLLHKPMATLSLGKQ